MSIDLDFFLKSTRKQKFIIWEIDEELEACGLILNAAF